MPKTLADNWLIEFYTLLSEQLKLNNETKKDDIDHKTNKVIFMTEKEHFYKALDWHVGKQSTYILKPQLLESLAVL